MTVTKKQIEAFVRVGHFSQGWRNRNEGETQKSITLLELFCREHDLLAEDDPTCYRCGKELRNIATDGSFNWRCSNCDYIKEPLEVVVEPLK